MSATPRRLLLAGAAALAAVASGCGTLPGRDLDPVVMTGAQAGSLQGAPAGRVVAFARHSGAWQQIPVQVDERATVDLGPVRNLPTSGVTATVYTDPNTKVGADPDPNLDANDEIAFMARDAGDAASLAPDPAGVVPASGVQVKVTDPTAPSSLAFVYLFRSDGSLSPGAGRSYVTYNFSLNSGNYLSTYDFAAGPNPESSSVTTSRYRRRFSDRWVDDGLDITAGGASGVDILDRHKAQFAPGVCGRTEDTFKTGGGGFIANKSGPVRAIRSFLGANSGTFTQRDHILYEGREDIVTYLRVHPIPGVMDYFDHSPAASGMTYRNDHNTGGVRIDGSPDTLAPGAPRWQQISGGQGTLTTVNSVSSDIPGLAPQLYYDDNSPASVAQCTGDADAYGSSGTFFNQALPSTDPRNAGYSHFTSTQTLYYGAPGGTAADAAAAADRAQAPLQVTTSPQTPTAPGTVSLDAIAYSAGGQPQGAFFGYACVAGNPDTIRIERKSGASWITVATTTANPQDGCRIYLTVAPIAAGTTVRAVATLGGATLGTSPEVPVD